MPQDRTQGINQLVQEIAAELEETSEVARAQIKRIVRTIGEKRALELVGQAQAIEATGGQELPDGSGKRTKGGVFFRLVREQTSSVKNETMIHETGN